jgi:ankyrin repeat protein
MTHIMSTIISSGWLQPEHRSITGTRNFFSPPLFTGHPRMDTPTRFKSLWSSGRSLAQPIRCGRANQRKPPSPKDQGPARTRFVPSFCDTLARPAQFGWTALHHSANWGYADCVAALLALGADPDARSESGKTPADAAAFKGFGAVAELLRQARPEDARACTLGDPQVRALPPHRAGTRPRAAPRAWVPPARAAEVWTFAPTLGPPPAVGPRRRRTASARSRLQAREGG